MCCSLVSNTNGPKTLLGTRMPDLSIADLLETDAGFI